jgi:hypothetical protein
VLVLAIVIETTCQHDNQDSCGKAGAPLRHCMERFIGEGLSPGCVLLAAAVEK